MGTFWAGWEQVEAASTRLARQPLPLAALMTESLAARGIIATLKARAGGSVAAARGDVTGIPA
jgi:hypothetical protein